MSMQNQKWSDISMLGRTQFKQAMLCNIYPKFRFCVCKYVCMYFFNDYL